MMTNSLRLVLLLMVGTFSEVTFGDEDSFPRINEVCGFGSPTNKIFKGIIGRSISPDELAYAYIDKILFKAISADGQEVWRVMAEENLAMSEAIQNHIAGYYADDLSTMEQEEMSAELKEELGPVETLFSIIVYLEGVEITQQLYNDIVLATTPETGIPSKQRYESYFGQIFNRLRSSGTGEHLAVLQAAIEAHVHVELDRGVNRSVIMSDCSEGRLLFWDAYFREADYMQENELPDYYWFPARLVSDGQGHYTTSYSAYRHSIWNELIDKRSAAGNDFEPDTRNGPEPKSRRPADSGNVASQGKRQSDATRSATTPQQDRSASGVPEASDIREQEASVSSHAANNANREVEIEALITSIQQSWVRCMSGPNEEQLNCLEEACPEIRRDRTRLTQLGDNTVILVNCDARIAQLQAAIQRDLARQDAMSATQKRLERVSQQSKQAESEAYAEIQKRVSMAQCMGGDKDACSVLDQASLRQACETMGSTSTSYPPCGQTTGQ